MLDRSRAFGEPRAGAACEVVVTRPPSASRAADGRHTVVFGSWRGYYADNPRAISEELWRRRSPVTQVWLLNESAGPIPDYVSAVDTSSPEAVAQLEEASYIVSNDVLPHDFRKRRTTTYLQTWHGTPLKRIAFDVVNPVFPEAADYEIWLPRDVARWDVLISPNRYATDVLRSAFRFDGEVIETGYPRNDMLLSADRDGIRARIREELNLAEDTTVVLYAPTWRDPDPFRLELDLEQMRRALGEHCVVLVRAHWLVAATVESLAMPNCLDVSGYQDLRELYLAADVLLTDYSSAMFDFAVTGKPMLFLVYDLALYRDGLRGFYFDFEAHAPGPLLTSTAAVIEALRDLDSITERFAEAYAAFRERFCHREDGRASARVVDALFGTDKSALLAPAGQAGSTPD